VALVSDTDGLLGASNVTPDAVFSLGSDWRGPAQQTAIVRALRFKEAGQKPFDYTGYAEQTGLQLGGADPKPALTLVDPDERTVDGSYTLPDGYTLVEAAMELAGLRHLLPALAHDGVFAMPVPVGLKESASLTFDIAGSDGGHTITRRGVPATGPLALSLAAPAIPLSPAADAKNVTLTTPFSWSSAPPDSVVCISWRLGEWAVRRVTDGASTTLPDLAAHGVPLPAKLTASWSVVAEGPAADTDALLEFQDAHPSTAQAPTTLRVSADLTYGWSPALYFTTAPL
jgi:hypothetical protein